MHIWIIKEKWKKKKKESSQYKLYFLQYVTFDLQYDPFVSKYFTSRWKNEYSMLMWYMYIKFFTR
jgi:hypothetical protein